MKKHILLTLILISVSCRLLASDSIITQGKIKITFEDIDGFAFIIPAEKRAGFFESPERIDHTLTKILNMKHVVDYGKNNNMFQEDQISENVNQRSVNIYSKNALAISGKKTMQEELEFRKMKSYLVLEESYKQIRKKVENSISENDVLELAKEQYLLNKKSYYHNEKRDIDYFAIIYNENNKTEQYNKAKNIKNELHLNNLNFKMLNEKYNNKHADIEIIEGLNNFEFDDKHLKFSEYVFKPNKNGLIDGILDVNMRYIIAVVNKISPEGLQSFSDVKSSILAQLMKNKAEREFGNMVKNLSQDKVMIDEAALVSLRTRYLNN